MSIFDNYLGLRDEDVDAYRDVLAKNHELAVRYNFPVEWTSEGRDEFYKRNSGLPEEEKKEITLFFEKCRTLAEYLKNPLCRMLRKNPFDFIDLVKRGDFTYGQRVDFCIHEGIIKKWIDENGKERLSGLLQRETVLFLNRIFNPYVCMADTQELFCYDKLSGIYKKADENKIIDFLFCINPYSSRKTELAEFIFYFKNLNLVQRIDVERLQPKDKICLRNGVLDLNTFQLEPFNKNYLFFSRLDIDFNPDADCPEIRRFVSDILPENEPAAFEVAAGILSPENFLNKLTICTGGGKNGKSTFIELLTRFAGVENTTTAQLSDLATDKHYCRASLFGKRLCQYADISSSELRDLAFIKSMCGEDFVMARNPYKLPFNFRYGGALIFSANEPPMIYEDTAAVWRRIHLLPFNVTISDDKKQERKALMSKLTTDAELSGLLNLALEGLKRLRENKKFSNDSDEDGTRKAYLNLSDSVFGFCEAYIDTNVSFDDYLVSKDVFAAYTSFCRERRKRPVDEKKFPEKFTHHTNSKKDRKTIGKIKEYVFFGVSFKKNKGDAYRPDYVDQVDYVISQSSNISLPKTSFEKYIVQPVQPVQPLTGDTKKEEKEEKLADSDFSKGNDGKKDDILSWLGSEEKPMIEAVEKFGADLVNKLLEHDGSIFEPRPGVLKVL